MANGRHPSMLKKVLSTKMKDAQLPGLFQKLLKLCGPFQQWIVPTTIKWNRDGLPSKKIVSDIEEKNNQMFLYMNLEGRQSTL